MLCGQAACESLDPTLLLEHASHELGWVPVVTLPQRPRCPASLGPLEPSLVYLLNKPPMKFTKTSCPQGSIDQSGLGREPHFSTRPKGMSVRSATSACSWPTFPCGSTRCAVDLLRSPWVNFSIPISLRVCCWTLAPFPTLKLLLNKC